LGGQRIPQARDSVENRSKWLGCSAHSPALCLAKASDAKEREPDYPFSPAPTTTGCFFFSSILD
jgi:hypothetical protein